MNPTNKKSEYPALLIIDMVKDNFKDERQLPITPLARKIIDPINKPWICIDATRFFLYFE